MTWPTPQDYNEAIQTPFTSFKDRDLKAGKPELTALGLPRPMTGAFASVYRMKCNGKDWAVRCFLNDIPDQKDRYMALSKFITTDDLVSTVHFEFLEEGVRIGKRFYPILRMEWVEGPTLIHFVESNLKNTGVLNTLADQFHAMLKDLQRVGVAHGDLQHGNIIVCGDELRLVDYDGMYVPALKGYKSNELGHRNYQHPQRTKHHFNASLDRFSSWVIYLSVKFLALDHSLWTLTSAGDEALLFKQNDFCLPEQSKVFRILQNHPSEEVREKVRLLRTFLSMEPDEVPELQPWEVSLESEGGVGASVGVIKKVFWKVNTWWSDLAKPKSAPSPTAKEPLAADDKTPTKKRDYSEPSWPDSFGNQQPQPAPSWIDDAEAQGTSTKSSTVADAAWPLVEQYYRALGSGHPRFRSGILNMGTVGDKPIVTNNSAVFHMHGPNYQEFAIKCFTNAPSDIIERYKTIEKELAKHEAPFLIPCKIDWLQVGTDHHPVLVMPWVQCWSLQDFLHANRGDSEILERVLQRLSGISNFLRNQKIAHGDLNHTNVNMKKDRVLLLDYDGMFVPTLDGRTAIASDCPGLYHHPDWTLEQFSYRIDDIATAILYISVLTAMWESALFAQYAGATNLLFTHQDLRSIKDSPLFQSLQQSEHRELRIACEQLEEMLVHPPGAVRFHWPEDRREFHKPSKRTSPIWSEWNSFWIEMAAENERNRPAETINEKNPKKEVRAHLRDAKVLAAGAHYVAALDSLNEALALTSMVNTKLKIEILEKRAKIAKEYAEFLLKSRKFEIASEQLAGATAAWREIMTLRGGSMSNEEAQRVCDLYWLLADCEESTGDFSAAIQAVEHFKNIAQRRPHLSDRLGKAQKRIAELTAQVT